MEIGRLCVDKETVDPFLLLTAFKYLVSLISSVVEQILYLDVPALLVRITQTFGFFRSLKNNQLAESKFQINKKSNSILDIKKEIGSLEQANKEFFTTITKVLPKTRWKSL